MIGFAIGAGAALAYAAFCFGLHLFFTRQQGRRIAAGAVFRARLAKHVRQGGGW